MAADFVDSIREICMSKHFARLSLFLLLFSLILAPAVMAQDMKQDPVLRQWASSAEATSQYGEDDWSATQATGEPNNDLCGDSTTAWASLSSTGVDDLTVYFDEAVYATEINIYESYNPGSITGVELIPADGGANIVIPDSAGSNTDCPGVFTVTLPGDLTMVNGVVIHLDQTIGGSWNEIDAVELVGLTSLPEVRQWASNAEATSQYGVERWSALQATGEPDTDSCGDYGSAWASQASTGVDDLTVYFDEAVYASEINIYQTHNPGSITGVEVIPANGGDNFVIPDSADPGTECPGVLIVTLPEDLPMINGVVIHLDQTIGGSWNEIDAVELVGVYERPTTSIEQWAAFAEATSQYGEDGYSATQATGEPNTEGCGDYSTAWASSSSTGVDDLAVMFEQAVYPTIVNIYQTYTPGSITGVELIPADGGANIPIPYSADPGTECPGVMSMPLPFDLPLIDGVVIHLDQTIGGNWNEIDAVQLIGVPE